MRGYRRNWEITGDPVRMGKSAGFRFEMDTVWRVSDVTAENASGYVFCLFGEEHLPRPDVQSCFDSVEIHSGGSLSSTRVAAIPND